MVLISEEDLGGPTSSPILSVAFHPKLAYILLASTMDGSTFLLDIRSQIPSTFSSTSKDIVVQKWRHHQKYVTKASFSPLGDWIVTGSHDKTVNLYINSVNETTEIPIFEKYEELSLSFTGAVESLEFMPRVATRNVNDSTCNWQTFVVSSRDDHLLYFISLPDRHNVRNGLKPIIRKYNMNTLNDS